MNLFGWLDTLFDDADAAYSSIGTCDAVFTTEKDVTNPANGLSMIGGVSGIDIGGNLYGTDFSHDSSWDSTPHGCGDSGFGGDW